jgi:hypothetical protein
MAARTVHGAAHLASLATRLLDLVGLPEMFAVPWRAATFSSRLTEEEVRAAESVFGPGLIRMRDVRVTQGGLLRPIFALNGYRGFALFHTVSLPWGPETRRAQLDLVIHELVHVLQHEAVGSIYLGQCIHAQRGIGYDYGGPEGLREVRQTGGDLRRFNREQQAQIVQDFFARRRRRQEVGEYEQYIADLRAGRL